MKKIYLAAITPLMLLLVGCQTSKNPTPILTGYTVTGKAELGYFDPSTAKCAAVPLDEEMNETGGSTPFTLKEGNDFKFISSAEKYIQLQCDVTYKTSKTSSQTPAKETIKVVGDLTQSTTINLNVGTTILASNIKEKYKRGVSYLDAEKELRANLFELAKIKTPTRTTSDLTTQDASVNGLQQWIFALIQMNREKHSAIDTVNAVQKATSTRGVSLPSGVLLPIPPIIIGTLAGVKINAKDLSSWSSISLKDPISIVIPKGIAAGFQAGKHHFLLQGDKSVAAMELATSKTTFSSIDIRSLFYDKGETTFTVCAVALVLNSCDGLKPANVQTFKLTGTKPQTQTQQATQSTQTQVNPLMGNIAIGTQVPRSAKSNLDMYKEATYPVILSPDALSNFDAKTHSVLVEGKETNKAEELILSNGKYRTSDISNLLTGGNKATTLQVCIVPKGIMDCAGATAAEVQELVLKDHVPVAVPNFIVVPPMAVTMKVNGYDLNGSLLELTPAEKYNISIQTKDLSKYTMKNVLQSGTMKVKLIDKSNLSDPMGEDGLLLARNTGLARKTVLYENIGPGKAITSGGGNSFAPLTSTEIDTAWAARTTVGTFVTDLPALNHPLFNPVQATTMQLYPDSVMNHAGISQVKGLISMTVCEARFGADGCVDATQTEIKFGQPDGLFRFLVVITPKSVTPVIGYFTLGTQTLGLNPITMYLGATVPAELNPEVLANFDATTDKLLIEGDNGTTAKELTLSSGKYRNSDIKSLLNPSGPTNVTLCVVPKASHDCSGVLAVNTQRFKIISQGASVTPKTPATPGTPPKRVVTYKGHATLNRTFSYMGNDLLHIGAYGFHVTGWQSVYPNFKLDFRTHTFITLNIQNTANLALGNMAATDKVVLQGRPGSTPMEIPRYTPDLYQTRNINSVLPLDKQTITLSLCINTVINCNGASQVLDMKAERDGNFLYIYMTK